MEKNRKITIVKGKDYHADLRKVRLGSKPFYGGIPYYVVRMEAHLVESTIKDHTRKLFEFGDILEKLKEEGKIKTTDPRHISEFEIETFLIWMRNKNLYNSTKKKYITVLDNYLGMFGNHIIPDMEKQKKFKFPTKSQESDIDFISEEDLRTIFRHIKTIEGWRGIIIRGYFSLCFGIVGRPKEINQALVKDLDLENEQFYIRHPKGEGSWGKPEWIPIIRGDMIPHIVEFFNERDSYCKSHEIESEYLFFNPKTKQPYSLNGIRIMKYEVERDTGINFKLKDFRSTYATITYRHSPDMKDAISKQMRHSSLKTTEKYYISYDNKENAKLLKDEWKKSKIE